MARELSLSGNKGERMTQLPDMSSLRTRGLDAALRAIGFVLWFSFILFCVGLNQSHGLASADDAFFAIIAKSLASGLGYATTFPVFSKEIAHPILFFPYADGSYVDCSLRDRFQNLRKE